MASQIIVAHYPRKTVVREVIPMGVFDPCRRADDTNGDHAMILRDGTVTFERGGEPFLTKNLLVKRGHIILDDLLELYNSVFP